ncbi:MAG: AmmeMemoRadiSam system protein A [Acidobacteria bacterium]|nr:AmmeMemoRadiSam system protein A [Acidobacteriota bacterium]
MSPLADEQKNSLLRIARQSISHAVQGIAAPAEIPPCVAQLSCAGAFVTLHIHGRLRGCIGRIRVQEPLAETIAIVAPASALEDPRFPRLESNEFESVEIEISVLTPPAAIPVPDGIQIGVHGLIVTQGHHRGLLLPQVAVQFHWTPLRFVEETCLKAGLPPNSWKEPSTIVETFSAEVFSEADFRTNAASKT